MLKYVRFHDLKQLDNEKLFELLGMIEYSLQQQSMPISTSEMSNSAVSVHHVESITSSVSW